jgi:hypothetical protein
MIYGSSPAASCPHAYYWQKQNGFEKKFGGKIILSKGSILPGDEEESVYMFEEMHHYF